MVQRLEVDRVGEAAIWGTVGTLAREVLILAILGAALAMRRWLVAVIPTGVLAVWAGIMMLRFDAPLFPVRGLTWPFGGWVEVIEVFASWDSGLLGLAGGALSLLVILLLVALVIRRFDGSVMMASAVASLAVVPILAPMTLHLPENALRMVSVAILFWYVQWLGTRASPKRREGGRASVG